MTKEIRILDRKELEIVAEIIEICKDLNLSDTEANRILVGILEDKKKNKAQEKIRFEY